MNIVDYLANGALIRILNNNNGPNPQPVWITQQPDGSFKVGSSKEPNSVGGKLAPFNAVQGGKIFRASQEEVEDFLLTFSLSKPQAQSVILKIGIEPRDSVAAD